MQSLTKVSRSLSQRSYLRHSASSVIVRYSSTATSASRPLLPCSPTTLKRQPFELNTKLSQRRYATEASSKWLKINPILLRDSCRCSCCVDPSSHQREFSFTDIPLDIQIESIKQSSRDSAWQVSWRNDVPGLENHVSCYTEAQLVRILHGSSGLSEIKKTVSLWDNTIFGHETEELDFSKLMSEDKTLSRALELIQQHGLVFIKQIPRDDTAVRAIVNRLALLKNTFYGETWDVRSVPQAKNVAYTSKILGFHMDLLYMKEPPGLQLLHSLENSCTGGESEFADTFKAIDVLRQEAPEHVQTLIQSRIKYGYDNDGYYYSDEKPVIKVGGDYHTPEANVLNSSDTQFMQHVERVYWSPPFIDTIVGASEDITRFLQASKAFADILQRPGMIYETKMEAGTCAVFDNLRVVHARKAFDVNSGKRWLKGVYGDQQDVLSKSVKHVWSRPQI